MWVWRSSLEVGGPQATFPYGSKFCCIFCCNFVVVSNYLQIFIYCKHGFNGTGGGFGTLNLQHVSYHWGKSKLGCPTLYLWTSGCAFLECALLAYPSTTISYSPLALTTPILVFQPPALTGFAFMLQRNIWCHKASAQMALSPARQQQKKVITVYTHCT